MQKKKKVIIIEKFCFDDEDHGIHIEPSLLLKLLEFAREEATTDEHLHYIVAKAHMMSHKEDYLEMKHYWKLIEPVVEIETMEKPTMEMEVKEPVVETAETTE